MTFSVVRNEKQNCFIVEATVIELDWKCTKIFINMLREASFISSLFRFIQTTSKTIEKFDNRKKSNQLDEWKERKNSSTANFKSATVLSDTATHNRASIIDS